MDRDVHNLLEDACLVFVKIEFDIRVLEWWWLSPGIFNWRKKGLVVCFLKTECCIPLSPSSRCQVGVWMCVCCKSLWANQVFSGSILRNLIILLQLQRHLLHLIDPTRVRTVLLPLACFYGRNLWNFHSVVPWSIPSLNDRTLLLPKLPWAISLWFYTLWELRFCEIEVRDISDGWCTSKDTGS